MNIPKIAMSQVPGFGGQPGGRTYTTCWCSSCVLPVVQPVAYHAAVASEKPKLPERFGHEPDCPRVLAASVRVGVGLQCDPARVAAHVFRPADAFRSTADPHS
jgi:hypothetical protein